MLLEGKFNVTTANDNSPFMKDPDWLNYGDLQCRRVVKEKFANLIQIDGVKTSDTTFEFTSKSIFLNKDNSTKLMKLLRESKDDTNSYLIEHIISILKS